MRIGVVFQVGLGRGSQCLQLASSSSASKAGRYTKPWFTPKLREEIKKRNALRRTIADNRAEYLDACAETLKLAEEARQKKLEEFLADLENNLDPARTWGTIKSLSGTSSSATFAETLTYLYLRRHSPGAG